MHIKLAGNNIEERPARMSLLAMGMFTVAAWVFPMINGHTLGRGTPAKEVEPNES